MEKRTVYLDHAATTPVKRAVFQKMRPYFTEQFGNANSQHGFGRNAVKAVDEARDTVAALIGAQPSEIYFTSGGTEADNWAVKGLALAAENRKKILLSPIEHPAVLESAAALESFGKKVAFLPVDETGRVILSDAEKMIDEDTAFLGVMLANNEIGTIEPVEELVKIAETKGVPVFSDAVQAIPCMRVNVQELGVSALSFSAHKFGGPKGVGVLYVRQNTPLAQFMHGGHQERARRGGTTNVPGVVGLAEALRITYENMEKDERKIKKLRDGFVKRVLREIPDVIYNGSADHRVSGNANFTFPKMEGETLLFRLDLAGIAASSGAACSTGTLQPSHVLTAIGRTEKEARRSVRFSFGRENTAADVDYTVETLKKILSVKE